MPIYIYNVSETRYVHADSREEADDIIYSGGGATKDQDIELVWEKDDR